jgi:hypothetical protein
MTNVRYLAPVTPRPAGAPRVRLSAWQRMQVEEARAFIDQAFDDVDLTGPRAAYLAGRLEGVAANLLAVLDAVTDIGDDD